MVEPYKITEELVDVVTQIGNLVEGAGLKVKERMFYTY